MITLTSLFPCGLLLVVCELGCQNGGQCTLGLNSSFCLCQPGSGGLLCDQPLSSSALALSSSFHLDDRPRQNFAVAKEIVMTVPINSTDGWQLMDADLYQVSVLPSGLVLYGPVVGEERVGRVTLHGAEASLSSSFHASSRILQVLFTPSMSWLGSNHSVNITLDIELILTFRADPSLASSASSSDSFLSKKLAILRKTTSVPHSVATSITLQSSGLSYTSLSLAPSSFVLFPTQQEADQAEFGEDNGGDNGASRQSDGLSNGTVAGIVIGCVAVVAALLVIGSRFLRRRVGSPAADSFSSAVVTEMSSHRRF